MKKAQRKAAKAGRQTTKKSSRAVPKKAAVKAAAAANKRAVTRPAAQKTAAPKSAARARSVRGAAGATNAAAGIDALVKRLQNLEDIMEISRLKAAYCEAVDGGWDRRTHNGEAVASLFVEDGVWDAGRIGGRGEGRQGIIDIINSFQRMPFALHRVTNPDIRINGDEATGKWHIIAYLSQPDGTPVMFMGTYRDKFVRTPQGWKFKQLGGKAAYFTSLREGWGTGEYYKQQAASGNGPQTE
jgi:SnoaL-like domain